MIGTLHLSQGHCFLQAGGDCTEQLQPGTYYAGGSRISFLPITPASGDSGADQSPVQLPVTTINYDGSQPNPGAQNPQPSNMSADNVISPTMLALLNAASLYGPNSTQSSTGVPGIAGTPAGAVPSTLVSSGPSADGSPAPPADGNPPPGAVADDGTGPSLTTVADNPSTDNISSTIDPSSLNALSAT